MNSSIGLLLNRAVRLGVCGGSGVEVDPRRRWEQARTCGILCGAGIGDALMALPLLRALRALRPSARIVVIANRVTRAVFVDDPDVDVVICYEQGGGTSAAMVRACGALRGASIDLLFATLPSNIVRHSMLVAAAAPRLALKHSYDYGNHVERDYSFLYSCVLPNDMERHRVELNLDFLRFLGEHIPEGSRSMSVHVPDEADRAVDEWRCRTGRGEPARTIAMHPGGGGSYKFWPANRFVEIARRLADHGWEVCLVGGEGERGLCGGIVDAVGMAGVYSVAGMFALTETAALLRRSRLLISNDTGIMHLATAVGLPVVALFGPTNYRHVGPFSSTSRVVERGADLSAVGVDDVMAAVQEVLEQDSHRSNPSDQQSNFDR